MVVTLLSGLDPEPPLPNRTLSELHLIFFLPRGLPPRALTFQSKSRNLAYVFGFPCAPISDPGGGGGAPISGAVLPPCAAPISDPGAPISSPISDPLGAPV